MVNCEYCRNEFKPRPQVKKPRACAKESCQKQRQRDNEKAWHKRNSSLYDRQYHRIKTTQRLESLKSKAEKLLRWIELGSRFTDDEVNLSELTEVVFRFCQELGIRVLNKLYA